MATTGKNDPPLTAAEAAVAGAFVRQLKEYEREHEHLFRDAVDACIDDTPGRRLPRDIWRQVFKRVAVLDLMMSSIRVSDAAEFCESPIEELLLLALHIVGRGDGTHFVRSQHEPTSLSEILSDPPRPEHRRDTLTIYQQVKVSGYRVDFLLFYNFVSVVPPGYKRPPKRPSALVVECDGHEFHEKTKAQAERDKGRDRAIQRAGFPVYHFSGSALWRDPLGCAEEAFQFLTQPRRHLRLAGSDADTD